MDIFVQIRMGPTSLELSVNIFYCKNAEKPPGLNHPIFPLSMILLTRKKWDMQSGRICGTSSGMDGAACLPVQCRKAGGSWSGKRHDLSPSGTLIANIGFSSLQQMYRRMEQAMSTFCLRRLILERVAYAYDHSFPCCKITGAEVGKAVFSQIESRRKTHGSSH
jgi:hypothetical protein